MNELKQFSHLEASLCSSEVSVKIPHSLIKYWEVDDCTSSYYDFKLLRDIDSWASGRFSFDERFFFFERAEDAMLYKLTYCK